MLEANELCKRYQETGAYTVEDINIRVERGRIHGLIGHNGSGKTTILKCLAGIYPPDRGTASAFGEPIYENVEIKEKIGYVADTNRMFSRYRVEKLVSFYEGIYKDFSRTEFIRLNDIFKVDVKKKITELSKGQQMRVSFMLNIAKNPEILLLDEPMSGLDAIAKKDFLDLLVTSVENEGRTVLISSHQLSDIEKICDGVTVLKNGRMMVQGDLDDVSAKISKYQVVFPNGAPKEFYERKDFLSYSNVGSVFTVILPDKTTDFEDEMKKIGAAVCEQMPIGLEESFVYMNKQEVE